jgi:CO/xanthine dehydrogenase Mo-binding subunit
LGALRHAISNALPLRSFRPAMPTTYIGRPLPRKEGREKVTGQARYVDDLNLPGMIYGATVRSPAPRGRITALRFDDGIPWSEFTIVTAKDIPGKNHVELILHDQPYLADGVVNHPEEPVLLLAHPDKYLLEKARRAVHIEIEPLPAIFTLDESLACRQVIWGQDNVFKSFLMEKGNVDDALARSDVVIVEGEYHTGAQEQLYIETNGMIAQAVPGESVTVWGSMQCPYYVHKALVPLFGLPKEKVRVIQTETGGGFGGKEEYPSMIAGHAALLAWKAGVPVKLIYDRAEDMVATTKRHPSRTRIRTAVTHDGQLVAQDIDFVLDGGAYATLSAVVLSRGTIHAPGPYFCPNVRVRSKVVATNAPPHGAFRGFGAPQSTFAMERHLNKVAQAVGLAPDELRRRNFLRQGQTTATGQVINEPVDLDRLLAVACEMSGYHAKVPQFAEHNKTSRMKKGMGFATFMHGAGFTGSGEEYLASVASAQATAEGVVCVLVANTEIGQGANTVFSQIAAEALSIPFEQVEIVRPDTGLVPNSGPTVASRTTMVVGKLVESAALGLKEKLLASGLLPEGYRAADFSAACARYHAQHGPLQHSAKYQAPPGIHWDDQKYQGDAYGTYAWAVYVAEVTVDTLTYEVCVDDFTAVQEVGRVIHPVLAAGQIEGGVAQGIGYALSENVVWEKGRMINGQMTNYIMPTSADVPRIRVHFEESPYAYGPGGAKGIGELPLDGTAPAVANAIENALGVAVDRIPCSPEALMELAEQSRK